MVARRRFEFYLHRDGCAAAIRVLSTQGGDATENRDFQREKQRLQGSNFFSDLILSKERIFFLEQGRGLF